MKRQWRCGLCDRRLWFARRCQPCQWKIGKAMLEMFVAGLQMEEAAEGYSPFVEQGVFDAHRKPN